MNMQPIRGVTPAQRQAWYWVPALSTLLAIFWLLQRLNLARWLGNWPAFGLLLLFCVGGGLLGGLVGRWYRFARADARGPWIILDDSTLKPGSFFDTALYQPIGKGYHGYLCGPAGVTPGRLYYHWNRAHEAIKELEAAHANVVKIPVRLRGYNDREWQEVTQYTAQLRSGYTPGFIVLPYYE